MSEKKLITKLEVAPFRAVEISIIGQLERLVVPLLSVFSVLRGLRSFDRAYIY